MTNTADLRYVRTEQAIRTSFMELVAEQPVGSVTASSICRHAGISRNAFYLHHAGVPELFASMVDELVQDLRAASFRSAQRLVDTGSADYELASAIVDVFAKHEQLLRALLPADDGSLAKRLAEELENAYVEAALLIDQRGSSFEHRMSCAFSASAHVGLMTRWIEETDRPIAESRGLFVGLQAGLTELATRFLSQGSFEE